MLRPPGEMCVLILKLYILFILGKCAPPNVSHLGVPRHDGAASALRHLPRGRSPLRAALGEHHCMELVSPRPAALRHDVLPRLRTAALSATGDCVITGKMTGEC